MKYLFFDIETIMGKTINNRIVSFGYVLTDEGFQMLAEEDIFINPQEREAVDNNFQWKQEATKDKEGFKSFYHKIRDLLEDKDTIVVGHGTKSDVEYLTDECGRFHFEPIDFDYMDTNVLANALLPNEVSKKLKNLYEYLCKDGRIYQAHRSLEDAKMTKAVFIELCKLARRKSIDIFNEQFTFNSLQMTYGRLENAARRNEEEFCCNFDLPIIAFLIEVTYEAGGLQKREKLHLYYDYALDKFFAQKHPAKGSQQQNSVLEEEAYKIAQSKGTYKLHQLWNKCKNSFGGNVFLTEENALLKEFHIKHIFYTVTSYEIYAKYDKESIQFDFNIVLPKSWFKNALQTNGVANGRLRLNLERRLKRIHSLQTVSSSMMLMAKMKFGYKDRNFPIVQEEQIAFNEDTDKYCLPKIYYALYHDESMEKGINSRLRKNDKEYIPTRREFSNNFLEEPITLPVLIERSL